MSTSDDLRYTSAPSRRERLLRLVEEQGYCTIVELSEIFAVSEMTVRRDVARLVALGRLRSFHGGVSALTPQELAGSDYAERVAAGSQVKTRIALRALEGIAPGAVIGLDAGSTVAALARQLPVDDRLRVVTASLPAITELAGQSGIEVTGLGGVLHPESLSFAGPSTLRTLQDLQIGTLFLAASGLNERGAYCATDFDAITKRALIEASEEVVLLSDSSKFSIAAMVKVCGWDAISTLIVDDRISDDAVAYVGDHGVRVITVPADDGSAP